MNQWFTYSISSSFPFFADIHTFSAKEKDTETGLSVTSLRSVSSSSLSQAQTSLTWRSLIRRFGSRYYSSDLSIWLSVDPMAAKYPSLSPYVYCANNPIKLVDPNGEEIDWVEKADGTIYWDENATSKETTKFGEIYLGKAGQRVEGQNVVNYNSDGSLSLLNPVEVLSDMPISNMSMSNSKCKEKINNICSFTSISSGMVEEAARSSYDVSVAAKEFSEAKVMRTLFRSAKVLGAIGEGLNISAGIYNTIKDPTGYNIAKLSVSAIELSSNLLNLAVPGLGTAVSIGISIIDINGGFDWLNNQFK